MNSTATKTRREAPLATPTDLTTNATRGFVRRTDDAARRCVRALSEDQELPLAHEWAAFPRLSSAARRAGGSDLRHDRSDRRARAQDRRNDDALDRPHCRMQRITDNDAEYVSRSTCWPSCARTTSSLSARHAGGARRLRRARDVATASLLESLDRRDRTARLVPVRGEPRRRTGRTGLTFRDLEWRKWFHDGLPARQPRLKRSAQLRHPRA